MTNRTDPAPTTPNGSEHDGAEHAHDEPLRAVTDRLDDEGFTSQFQAVADAEILCLTCRQRFPAASQRADDVSRLEGASDPADEALVLRVVCPRCDARGVLVVRYGPEASADEADLLVDLDRTPRESGSD